MFVFSRRHMCMAMRGVQKSSTQTVTNSMLGVFRENPKIRDEFFRMTSRH